MTAMSYDAAQAPPVSRAWKTWVYVFGPLLGLAAVYLLFAVLAPRTFSTPANFVTMLRQTAIVGTAALGMTIIIISGGIDLSVGSMIALVTVAVASSLNANVSPLAAAGAGVIAGAAMGILNGSLVAFLGVGPFIVTLGTLLILRGAAKQLAHSQTVLAPPSWLNDLLAPLPPDRQWMLLPPGVWLMIGLALLVSGFVRYTRLGRHVFAVGSNEQTARLCGVSVPAVKVSVYALGGMLTGVAGLMQFSRLTLGDPTAAAGMELDVIAAVVIGGGSLSGGQGSVVGSLIGALIMTVIRNGCNQMGVENPVQEMLTGAIIVLAVTLDRLRQRRTS